MKMNTNYLLLLIFWSFSFSVLAQNYNIEKPDYDKIEKNISDVNSNFFYENLFKRYLAADTTLSIDEKRHIYYGYTFQKEYNPMSNSNFEDSLRIYYRKPELTNSDYPKIIEFSEKVLEENPFDLRALHFSMIAYEQNQNSSAYLKNRFKFDLIIDVIMSSGDGIAKDSAFYVIYVSHEYDLIDIIGFNFGGEQSLIDNQFDYLKLDTNQYHLEGFYFDISPSLNYLGNLFKN
jgi:hypothetical protein